MSISNPTITRAPEGNAERKIWRGMVEGLARDDYKTISQGLSKAPFLLEFGPAPERWTLLHHAACDGSVQVVWTLIEKGANVNAVTSEGVTPLHLVAQPSARDDNALTIAKALVKRGANVNAQTNAGQNPLFSAVFNSRAKLAEFLLAAGCDPRNTNHFPITTSVLHWAKKRGLTEIERLLRDAGLSE